MSVVLPENIKDYEVKCNFVSCIPATGSGQTPSKGDSGPRMTNSYGGILVEKHTIIGTTAEFTIFVPFTPGIANMVNEQPHWANLLYPGSGNSPVTAPAHDSMPFSKMDPNIEEKRISHSWSAFRVISNQGNLGLYGANWNYQTNPFSTHSGDRYMGQYINPESLPAMMVTYPTVEFSVIGYTRDFNSNYISDTDLVNELLEIS